MQKKERLSLILLHQRMIKRIAVLVPVSQKSRLPFGQIATHGKISFGQIDGLIIILRHDTVSVLSFVSLLVVFGFVVRTELQFTEIETRGCLFMQALRVRIDAVLTAGCQIDFGNGELLFLLHLYILLDILR